MASSVLYAPIVDNYIPAFIASGDSSSCRLYFSLSKYSSVSQIKSIHISVVKQNTGQNVVRRIDSENRFRSTGIIILNTSPIPVENENNLYYIDILNEDIQSGDNIGWYPSWIYKIQLRFSLVPYTGEIGQAAWLNINSNNFSEWSTYCTTKAIYKPVITIPILKNFNSNTNNNDNEDIIYNISESTLEFKGSYENQDPSETLYSYKVILYDNDKRVIEESDILYSNQFFTPNQFYYLFKTEMNNETSYILKLNFTTINKYEGEYIFNLYIDQDPSEKTDISIVTIDNIDNVENKDFVIKFKKATSIEMENEEGRVALKLYNIDNSIFSGNLCIRRTDSKSDYSIWEDIKIINCLNTKINDLDIIYDNTIESNVWYKYGVQIINSNEDRELLNSMNIPIIRSFEFSFLIGENGRQLKLSYNNSMNNYSYTLIESKTDTIGSQYPFISRNGNVKYRTFPVNGLITFNMDQYELFTNDKELYQYDDVIESYKERREQEFLSLYDHKKEFDFREKVLDFLQDGKPKLFKSSSEGNILIRLMNVATQPNQTLNRLIFSFTSTAYEIGESSIDNYKNYGILKIGEIKSSFEESKIKIGQLDLDFNIGDDIIAKIYEIYDNSNKDILSNVKVVLNNIHHLNLTFTDSPLRIYNNANELVLGNNFKYNNSIITVNSQFGRIYSFDENMSLTKDDRIEILGGIDSQVGDTIHVTVDFLYNVTEKFIEDKKISSKTITKNLGQIYDTYKPNENIYNDIYYKYYYEWDNNFRKLSEIRGISIEANPGSIFFIKDNFDAQGQNYEINETGLLSLENIASIKDIYYVGKRNEDGSIREENVDVLMDYLFYTTQGTYKGGSN